MGLEDILNLELNEALDKYETLYGEKFNFPNYSKSFLEFVDKIIDSDNSVSIFKEFIEIEWTGNKLFNFKYYTDSKEKYCYISSFVGDQIIIRESHFEDLDYTIDKISLKIKIYEAANQVNTEKWRIIR